MKKVSLGELFTKNQLEAALLIVNEYDHSEIHDQIRDKIIKPSMEHINQVTGQQNSADYWAYCLEYAIMECK